MKITIKLNENVGFDIEEIPGLKIDDNQKIFLINEIRRQLNNLEKELCI